MNPIDTSIIQLDDNGVLGCVGAFLYAPNNTEFGQSCLQFDNLFHILNLTFSPFLPRVYLFVSFAVKKTSFWEILFSEMFTLHSTLEIGFRPEVGHHLCSF